MYLCFMDESGSPPKPTSKQPRPYFIISAVIMHEAQWHGIADELKKLKAKPEFNIQGEINRLGLAVGRGLSPPSALRRTPDVGIIWDARIPRQPFFFLLLISGEADRRTPHARQRPCSAFHGRRGKGPGP